MGGGCGGGGGSPRGGAPGCGWGGPRSNMARQSAVDLAEKVRVQAERSGAEEAETYLESSTTTEVRLRQGQVELLQQSIVQGIGLRVFRDRRMGFLYTTDLRDTVLTELVNRTLALTNQA